MYVCTCMYVCMYVCMRFKTRTQRHVRECVFIYVRNYYVHMFKLKYVDVLYSYVSVCM